MSNYILVYPETTLIYCATILVGVLFAAAAQSNKKAPVLFVVLCVSTFVIVSGLRGSSVGADTLGYLQTFEALRDRMQWRVISISDPGFLLCGRILMVLFSSPQVCLFAAAAAINGLIIFRLWDFREYASFPLMVLSYGAVVYFTTLSGIRQFIAVALVFWASRYLDRKKYVRYALFVFLAMSFHKSAFVAFLPLLLEIVFHRKDGHTDKKDYMITLRTFMIVASPLLILIAFNAVTYILETSNYFRFILDESASERSSILMTTAWAVLVVAYIIDYFIGRRGLAESERVFRLRVSYNVTLYLVLYWVAGLFFPSAIRIGWYFLPSVVLLFSQPYCSGAFKRLNILFLFAKWLIAGYTLYAVLAYGGNGQVPYEVFWV